MPYPPVSTVTKSTEETHHEAALVDAREFINDLRDIRQNDRGRMSALKRNAGEMLTGRGASWFYAMIRSDRRKRHREIYFLIATHFDFNRHEGRKVIGGDFGRAMLQLANNMQRQPKEFRRFHILLDAEFDRIHDVDDLTFPWVEGGGEMAFRLRQMVKLMASKDVGIDWPQLLVDLCSWSHPNRRIQKKWARSFFGDPTPLPNDGDEET